MVSFIMAQCIEKWRKPGLIISDNGKEFVNAKVKHLLLKEGVAHSFFMPYFPQGNGLVEKTNHSVMRKVWKLAAKNATAWDFHLKDAVQGYNISYQQRMKSSPQQSLCGRVCTEYHLAIKQIDSS
ncbi:hypothetical protein PAPHI01_2781 [Pancytospora philotis]|nr:hypothetical protein PAPHI01_2781 [Pancytospora philotis]